MALVSMGIKHNSLESYAQRARRLVLPTPTQAVATKQIGILQTGQKRPHPSHIPDHLPAFPDSHAYVQTPVCCFPYLSHIIFLNNYCFFKTHKQPITDYETIREKASCQKRDVERALTRFVAKTGETQSFFLVEDLTHYPRK
jgi:transcription initiation factor TFIID subunit 8